MKSLIQRVVMTLAMGLVCFNVSAQNSLADIQITDQSVTFVDTCPVEEAPEEEEVVVTPVDTDGDGIVDDDDNCVVTANSDQSDVDADGFGDVCDACAIDEANDENVYDENDEDGSTEGCAVYLTCSEPLPEEEELPNLQKYISIERPLLDASTASCVEGNCETLTLTAVKDHDPDASFPAHVLRQEPKTIILPFALWVTEGNAANFYAYLHFKLGDGETLTCTYRGQSSTDRPSGFDILLGQNYIFQSCSDNTTMPGFEVTADDFLLEIEDGAQFYCPDENCEEEEEILLGLSKANTSSSSPRFVELTPYAEYERTVVRVELYDASLSCGMVKRRLLTLDAESSEESNGLDVSEIVVTNVSEDGQVTMNATCSSENNTDAVTTQWALLEAPTGIAVTSENAGEVTVGSISGVSSGTVRMRLTCRQGCLETFREGSVDLAALSAALAVTPPGPVGFTLGGGNCSLNQAATMNFGGAFGLMAMSGLVVLIALRQRATRQ